MTDTEMRELDEWIAEHVLPEAKDCPMCEGKGFNDVEKYDMVEQVDCMFCGTSGEQPFGPTTDPAAAMMVLEKCVDYVGANQVSICKTVDDFVVWCPYGFKLDNYAPTLPLAICLFAKQLFGGKEQ